MGRLRNHLHLPHDDFNVGIASDLGLGREMRKPVVTLGSGFSAKVGTAKSGKRRKRPRAKQIDEAVRVLRAARARAVSSDGPEFHLVSQEG
jgi:hypothetical protein